MAECITHSICEVYEYVNTDNIREFEMSKTINSMVIIVLPKNSFTTYMNKLL